MAWLNEIRKILFKQQELIKGTLDRFVRGVHSAAEPFLLSPCSSSKPLILTRDLIFRKSLVAKYQSVALHVRGITSLRAVKAGCLRDNELQKSFFFFFHYLVEMSRLLSVWLNSTRYVADA